MGQLIITVGDKKTEQFFDTEIPDDLEVEELAYQLAEALNGMNPQLRWNTNRLVLYSPKLGRNLKSENTLQEEGIWNGDYLYIMD